MSLNGSAFAKFGITFLKNIEKERKMRSFSRRETK